MPVATAVVLPLEKIQDLRAIATPQKPWFFGKAIDRYYDFIEQSGKRVEDFQWGGDYMIETFNYLKKVEIDLAVSEYDDLVRFLDGSRGGRHFILTRQHVTKHLERLQTMSYVESFLRSHYEQVKGAEDPDAGRVMKDALQYICILLEDLPEDSITIVGIE